MAHTDQSATITDQPPALQAPAQSREELSFADASSRHMMLTHWFGVPRFAEPCCRPHQPQGGTQL